MLAAVEFVGPCRFAGWSTEERPDLGISIGDPVAKEHPRAWVQLGAVAKDQNKNTMTLFPGMFTKACMDKHGIDIGKEIIYSHGGARRVEVITSASRSAEGNRPTFIIKNEALTLDTPIPTPSGWTTMGDLKDGDTIFGSDGRPTVVVKAHEVQYGRRTFEVEMVDGTIIEASDGHWWTSKLAGSAAKVKDRTTLEMLEDGRRFMLPRPGPREMPEADLPVDPYLLGAWLGDGSTGQPNITAGDQDIDDLEAQLNIRGVQTHRLKVTSDRAGRIGFDSQIRRLACYLDKHIPVEYLNSSVEQRLELLRGLMDTDGCLSRAQNQAIFVGRERLVFDVLELLRSLGQTVGSPKWVEDSRSTDGGYFRLTFTPYRIQPFSLSRKADRVQSSRREWVSIASIREIPSKPVRCITVDAEDHLFQAGPAGHVTRNTHHWVSSNGGPDVDAVLGRNKAKAKGGQARALAITNAYQPSDDSIAQREREAWEAVQRGEAPNRGFLYDSLEAPPDARLTPPTKKGEEPTEEQVTQYVTAVLHAVRGDATWLDTENILDEIFNLKNAPSQSRRFYYNVIIAAEDSWVDPAAVKLAVHPLAAEARRRSQIDPLRCGWEIVSPDDEIAMFFDGSKSDDSTALVGVRLDDLYTFVIGVWQRPRPRKNQLGKLQEVAWLAPREEVDNRVREAFRRFKVRGFWADPSHAKDDDDATQYWRPLIDAWHRDFQAQLEAWPRKSGIDTHSVLFDMSNSLNLAKFVPAAEQFVHDLQNRNDVEEYAPLFFHDGHPALIDHMMNAKDHTSSGYGTSLMKENRSSYNKIDLAVAAVGAHLCARSLLNQEKPDDDLYPNGAPIWGGRRQMAMADGYDDDWV